MRVSGQFLIAALVATSAAAQTPAPDPQAILGAARAALGGDARIAAVKTLVVTGRTRQVRGDNLVPIEFELSVELPDKYLRKDEVPAQESGPTATGFSGDLLLEPPNAGPPAGRAGGTPPTAEQQAAIRATRLIAVKQDFARLMLGLFASAPASYPLTFTYVGQAEAPQGMADVLEGKGAQNLTIRLFVHRDTHLPVMLSWQGTAADGRRGGPAGRGPVPPASGGDVAPPAGAAAIPENRLYFADYRDVDGVKFPFRLRRALGAETTEETTFDRYRVNAKIDPRKFEVRK